jgi:hypothetical protein
MKLPFTVQQFLEVFKDYNLAVYPMQVIFYVFAATVIFLLFKKSAPAGKIINGILSFLWLWMGIVYHLLFFTAINKAAYVFGSTFIIQGLLFIYHGAVKNNLAYQFRFDKYGWLGALFIFFSLVVYPLLGFLFGHLYPFSPTFGLPCPTTIFTFGILLFRDKKIPLVILLVPFVWSIIGFLAAVNLGIREDISLLIAGISATILIILRRRVRTIDLEH